MFSLCANDVAIAFAVKSGSLRITEETGRFGPYYAVSDDHGLIEIANSRREADDRVAAVVAHLERKGAR